MPEPSLPKWTICDISRFPYVYIHVECVPLHRWSAKSFIAESTDHGCQREAESIEGKTAVLSRNNFFSSGSVSSFSFSLIVKISCRECGNGFPLATLASHKPVWVAIPEKSLSDLLHCAIMFIRICAIMFIRINMIVFIRINMIVFIRINVIVYIRINMIV